MPNSKRNREIISFYEANDWSYQLVADKFGVSRNVVAGAIFRHRNGGRKRNGRGYRGGVPWPAYNLTNSAVLRP